MPAKISGTADTESDLSVPAARDRWRSWADEISRGGPQPPSRVVLDTAVVLDIADPSARLAADAKIIREVRDLEARASAIHDQVAAARAEYGGIDGVRAKIREVRAELARLERLDGVHPRSLQAGSMSGQATRLRQSRPDLFEKPSARTARRARR